MKTTHLLGYDGRSGEVEAGRSAFKARVDYIRMLVSTTLQKRGLFSI